MTKSKDSTDAAAVSKADEAARASKDKGARLSLAGLKWFEADAAPIWRDRAIVLFVVAVIFLPFLGSFGLWDPWETHYGEVGRQITERNDWISTWWGSHWAGAGGAVEGTFFFSKPILLMWMMAIGIEIFGVNDFAIRIGVALVAMLGVLLVYSAGASVFSRRVGFLMAGVLSTSPFWFFLGRQAQTDMPFVGLMTVGMCFFLMGVFGKDRKLVADKLSYVLTLGWVGAVVIPQISLVLVGLSRWRGGDSRVMDTLTSPAITSVIAGAVLLGIGALVLLAALWKGRSPTWRFRLGLASAASVWGPLLVLLVVLVIEGSNKLVALNGWFSWGPTQAALYASCLGVAVYWTIARPTLERGRLYLLTFYVFIGLATLAKGLLGFMLPGAILFFYILLTREWRLLKEVELFRGILIFIAVTFPWYAAMLIRHHPGFWQRFFVHDHFKRLASGVHQLTTGSFEHFARWLGYGLFPWAAFIPAAFARLFGGRALRMDDDRGRATLVLVLWAVLAFTLFTLSSTKFHHYIFPVVPAVAMLVALALDDLLDGDVADSWPLYLVGVGIMGIVAWDIIDDPQMLKNLFTYQYDREWDHGGWDSSFRWWIAALIAPGFLGSTWLLTRNRRMRRAGVGLLLASGFALAVFSLNVYMPKITSTWSQKGLWDRYYELCTKTDGPPGSDKRKHYCEEPAVSYKLNWRGETYYTANEVVPIRSDNDFTQLLGQVGDDGTFYGIMELSRFRGEFQRKLPEKYKDRSCVVHDDNLKFVLAKVPCEKDDPNRLEPADRTRVRR
ncbi:MAG: glycosyltransferase family 39 protein [Bradymonadaceae bacterium]|nr:glycosyltransferase family 39 protein [Lujinxingiaceae bacterium]